MSRIGQLAKEALAVVLIGIAFAFAANAVSPCGLSLRRDYFRTAPVGFPGTRPTPTATTGTPSRTEEQPLRTKRGLPAITRDEAVALYQDPGYAGQRIVFIDARDEAHYTAGHIPGAYPFDHYHPGKNVATILSLAPLAERIVVYCTGGDCEDSELATLDLIDMGVPAGKLVVYAGGITEWARGKLPVETGERGSNRLQPGNQ